MRIMGLKAENIKRLKMVEITPDGNIIKITGKNGQGKTSVIDSILLALGGSEAAKLTQTSEPIHNGAKKGQSVVDIGDYIVTRSFTETNKAGYLKVEAKDGSNIASPQALLSKIVGDLSFDPLSFLNMESDKQIKILQKLMGFDPKPLDDMRLNLFNERTLVNREVKALQTKIKDLNGYADVTLPDKEEEAATIMKEFNEANDTIKENNVRREEVVQLRLKSSELKAEIETLNAQMIQLQQKKESVTSEREAVVEKGKALAPEVAAIQDPDLAIIQERMSTLDETNRKIRSRNEWRKMDLELTDKVDKASSLTDQIEMVEKKKADAIKNAKLPVEGLSYDESGVKHNGLPLSQSSHSQQIVISMSMGMAINPDLRVMFVKDGEKFDSDTWKLVESLAHENDYQIWIEMVEESGKVGVYIEDGMVKEYDDTAAK